MLVFAVLERAAVRRVLGNFGLESLAHKVQIQSLSGGQKARVAFADLFLHQPHVLLLDEPTNHLDIESVDALIEAINEFQGGVVCVTHDAALIERTEMELWVCKDGGCVTHAAGFEDYRDGVLAEIEAEAAEEARRAEEKQAARRHKALDGARTKKVEAQGERSQPPEFVVEQRG